ncbi:LytR/AlgR family response regulator transcription factor [Psychrobacillus soli]|uniref:LytTR family transcriptional regulator n=1 Tax=Psychrobacillus soli TaxID=1543965 RepID=A0A544T9M4_9BACI|nr:LytTR family DNA-binding domain-containing protein [Psychrobacillus soli]TQR14157.1 LytTR family transcriptional regulator [Psychrobacillus soli]
MEISKDELLPYIAMLEDWIPKEASIAIAVRDEYIYCDAKKQNLRLENGQKVKEGSITEIAMQTCCRTEGIVEDFILSEPYYGIAYPINILEETGALIVILPSKQPVINPTPYRFLTGKLEEEWRPIPIEKIAYMESLQKKTWFYADKEPYKTSIPLKELQQRLPESFLRIHRSYIVNVAFIDRIIRDFSSNLLVLLQDGTELPVSQTYTADVRSALGF